MNLLFLLPLALLLASGTGSGTAKARHDSPAKKPSPKAQKFQAAAQKVASAAKSIAVKALQAKQAGKPVPKLPANAKQAQAARALCAYLKEPGANWGRPLSPSPQVIAAQAALGVKLTGYTDAATRMAIAKTGVVLPTRPAESPARVLTPPAKTPAKPAASPSNASEKPSELAEQVKAARVLAVYLKVAPPKTWGTKNAPNKVVQAFQAKMGLTADGIYGPQTRAAGARVGVPLPARK
jgi:peptidoglycan hydrolase-like protein with peptidoglycan-binding domain